MATFDSDAFDVDSFDVDAFDLTDVEIGPTPDVTPTGRRRMGMFVKRGGVGRLGRRN